MKMNKAVVFFIAICVICVSMSGAAVSVKKTTEEIITFPNDQGIINQPSESAEVNTQVLNRMNTEVDKYLNMEEYNPNLINYINNGQQEKTTREVFYPWSDTKPLFMGDFVDWVIRVNYGDKSFEEEIDISPIDFEERFLKHPMHFEDKFFDVDEDGDDDLRVCYSFFTASILNTQKNIEVKGVKSILRVDAGDIPDRYVKLEVWSEIKLNFGLIKDKSRDVSKPVIFDSKLKTILGNFVEKLEALFENTGFNLIENILRLISSRLNRYKEEPDPPVAPLAADDDWISVGIGIASPEGEKTPLNFEKRFGISKENIFQPLIFEHELYSIQSVVPLQLLFGFKSGKFGTSTPTFDAAFGLEFNPAVYIHTQFIPIGGYAYYGWDSKSASGSETKISLVTNIIKGSGEDIDISLIFDDTLNIASSNNWMSFDIKGIGFEYRANKKHDVGFLFSSPIFSGKLKFVGIPKQINCEFDVDLSFVYQQGQLLETTGIGTLKVLDMGTEKIDDIILYYPELDSEEPIIEFVKISNIPSTTLSAMAHLYVKNDTMTTIQGDGYLDLTMGSNLGPIQAFYRKADPNDPDKLFVKVPSVPRSNRIGAEAKLYMDMDDFTNPNNYVYGKAYRDSSGNLDEISAYLPGETVPIVSITDIPADTTGEAKLTWNKLKGYAYVDRRSAGGPDPITINVDIGTFHVYNFLQVLDGHIDCDFYLNENGYFGFDTANDMIGDTLEVEDTSTGNILVIDVYKVSANNLDVDWVLDMSKTPIPIEELYVGGSLSLLEDFYIDATYQGKYLDFEGNWKIGDAGEFSLDFNQADPIELILDDLFPSNPTWDLGGGIIISQDFHFDMKWKWEAGTLQDPGYFKINEDSNNPNFDWCGIWFTYTPDGYTDPQFGIEIGGNNIGLIVWVRWWDDGTPPPAVSWWIAISGNFYCHLLWKGTWYQNIHTW
jgi:hypothetical protein